MVEEAIQSIDSNYSITEIISRLDDLRFNNSIALYTVETLKYLRKGGRIGKVEGTVGDILAIKPIISVSDEGVYYTVGKAFGVNRALITMRNIVKKKYGDSLIDVTIHYGTSIDKAEKVASKMSAELHIRNINIVQLTPVLGVHTGPEIIAFIVRKV
jgi:DegV family protein with EDD domain